ncbi:hypothetical protein ACWCXB_24065 [Streptomyces sp. NPDC001514]
MTRGPADFASVDNGTVDVGQALRHLQGGRAVVLPSPAPLASVVAATRAHVVNQALGRPLSFPTVLWLHHAEIRAELRPMLDLTAQGRRVLDRLLSVGNVILSVPVRRRHAEWIEPALKDGRVHVFGLCWQVLRPVIDPLRVLFVDHAERGGRPPAGCAAEAIRMFPLSVPVLGTAGLDAGPLELGVPDGDLGQRLIPATVRLNSVGQASLHGGGSRSTRWAHPRHVLDAIDRTRVQDI